MKGLSEKELELIGEIRDECGNIKFCEETLDKLRKTEKETKDEIAKLESSQTESYRQLEIKTKELQKFQEARKRL